MSYLQWSLPVRLLPPQIQLPKNGQTHKEPVAETVVVDQPEDIFYTQVDKSHDALQKPNHTEKHWDNVRKQDKIWSKLKISQQVLCNM